MNAKLGLPAARELGVRASLIAVVVAVAGSASKAAAQWSRRRQIAASHEQAGWQ